MKIQTTFSILNSLLLLIMVSACSTQGASDPSFNDQVTATSTYTFIFATATPDNFLEITVIPETTEEIAFDQEPIFIRCESSGPSMSLIESLPFGICFSIPDDLPSEYDPDTGSIKIQPGDSLSAETDPGEYFILVSAISKGELDLDTIKSNYTSIDGVGQLEESISEINTQKVGVFKTDHENPQYAFVLIEQPDNYILLEMNAAYFVEYEYTEDYENVWSSIMDTLLVFPPTLAENVSYDENETEITWSEYQFEYLGIGLSAPDDWEINRQPSRIGIIQPGLDVVFSIEFSNPPEYTARNLADLANELELNYPASNGYQVEQSMTDGYDSLTATGGLLSCQEIFIPTTQRVVKISVSQAVCDPDHNFINPLIMQIIESVTFLD